MIMRAMRGSTGRRAIWRPVSVSRSLFMALSSSSSRTPSVMLRGSGGSTKGNARTSPRRAAAIWRMTEARLVRWISGSVYSGRELEVLFRVQPDADAVGDAAAAALALVGAGLRDGLDGEALDLGAQAVAGDAGGARVDDVADAGDGERGLRDVGGEHDAAVAHGPAGGELEDAVLFGGGQAAVEREDVEVLAALEGVGGVADLALAGEEHEDVAGTVRARARRWRR